MKVSLAKHLRDNWKSGVTVGLVSLPLSISLAIAANASPVMGVITAIWAGFFASLFGGSHYNIIGPTGALSGVLAAYALTHGTEALLVLAVLSGVLCLLAYLLRLEKYLVFIPSSVIHGFTLGVAIIILLSQLNFILGLNGLPEHEGILRNIQETFSHLKEINWPNFILFAVGVGLLFGLAKWLPKWPGTIIVALLGLGVGYGAGYSEVLSIPTLATKFGELPARIAEKPSIPEIVLDSALIKATLTITLIAILETLISGKIADGMTKTKFNARRELLGLGFGNIASGVFGGIPATAALARTALNIKTGATHRTSALLSSLTVAVIALFLLPYFKFLPLAMVGAILVNVALRMIQAEHFIHLFQYDRKGFVLSLLVAVITVLEDPMIGILMGAAIALLIFVHKLSSGQSEVTINKNKELVARITGADLRKLEEQGDTLVYRLAGQLTYVNAQSHLEMVEQIHDVKVVILSFRSLFYIDLDGLMALHEIVDILERNNEKVLISGVGPVILPLLQDEDWYERKLRHGESYPTTGDALRELGYKIGQKGLTKKNSRAT